MMVFDNLLHKLNGPATAIKLIVHLYARGGVVIRTPDIQTPLLMTVIQPDGDVNTLLRNSQIDGNKWKEHLEKLNSAVWSLRQLRGSLRWLSLLSLLLPLFWEIYNIAAEHAVWDWSLRYLVVPLGFLVMQIIGRLVVFWIKHQLRRAGNRYSDEEWR